MIAESLLKQYTKEATALLRRMIAIPSPSFEERDVADMLQGELAAMGLNVERFHNNLICRGGVQSNLPLIMLCAHIDTVTASESYSRNPYGAEVENGTIYGLGSNDDGASVVSLLEAFRHCSSKANLILVLSAEEERSGKTGMEAVVAHLKEIGTIPHYTIIGEPTGLKAAVGERGLLVLDGEATGVAGHAAREEGVNALYKALDDIAILRNHKFERVSPLMGRVKLTVTQINAGYVHNVVPDKCTFVVDIRPTDLYNNREIWEELQAKIESTLTPRKLTNRSSATPAEGRLMDAIDNCGLEKFLSPTTSDWMKIEWPAVKIGPGESSRSHKADEYVHVEEIHNGISTYIKLIQAINGNNME